MRILMMVVALAIFATAAFASPRTSPPRAATAPSVQASSSTKWKLAEGAPPELQKVIDDQPSLIYAEIFPVREKLNRMEAKLAAVKGNTRQAKAERESIEVEIVALRDEIKAIESDESIRLTRKTPREPGEYGMLHKIRVVQVMDEQSAVVEVLFFIKQSEYDQHPEIDYDRCFKAWLSGIDTSGWTDDKQMDLSQYAYSPGTYKSGERTLLEIRPFSMSSFVRADE